MKSRPPISLLSQVECSKSAKNDAIQRSILINTICQNPFNQQDPMANWVPVLPYGGRDDEPDDNAGAHSKSCLFIVLILEKTRIL